MGPASPDSQCGYGLMNLEAGPLFADCFEPGDTSAWSTTVPYAGGAASEIAGRHTGIVCRTPGRKRCWAHSPHPLAGDNRGPET